MVDLLRGAKGGAVGAIDRRRRRIDEMPAAIVAAPLQHIEKPDDVGVGIGVRINQGMAHAGLRCEMYHRRKPLRRKQPCGPRAIAEIEWLKLKIRERLEPLQPRPLQGRIIVTVEIVHADNATAKLRKAVRDVRADEAGRSGHQDRIACRHAFLLPDSRCTIHRDVRGATRRWGQQTLSSGVRNSGARRCKRERRPMREAPAGVRLHNQLRAAATCCS